MLRNSLFAIAAILALTACVPSGAFEGLASFARKPNLNADVPRGYARLFNNTEYGFRYAQPGEPVRRGETSERYELRSGECGGSDCGNPRYRSEIRADEAERQHAGKTWFGWSFYNANIASTAPEIALKPIFGQWKFGGPTPAAVRLVQLGRNEGNFQTCDPAICNRSSDGSKDVVLELRDMADTNNWGTAENNGYICRLFSMEQARGTWTDLVLNSNFSSGPDGFLRVWVNGELACNYIGPVRVSGASNAPINHRRGIFVSYTERWEAVRGDAPKPTMIVHYDEFLAGETREEVDTRLREAAGVPPVD